MFWRVKLNYNLRAVGTQFLFGRCLLDTELIDVEVMRAVSARELIEKFLAFVRPSLKEYGDWDEVSSLVRAGDDAARKRRNAAAGSLQAYRTLGGCR